MNDLRIHALELPTPFDVGALNAYLVLGDEPTLVDTGVRTDEAWSALEAGLARHHLQPGDIRRIVLTHGHADHYGQAARIRRASGAEVIAHARTTPIVADFPWDRPQVVANTLDFFTRHGASKRIAERAAHQLASGRALQEPVGVDRTVAHGDELDLGIGACFRVFEVAGHLPGHVVLYHEASRTLLSGDQLLAEAPTVPFLYLVDWHEGRRPSSLNLYLASLMHIARLDVDRVLPAHGRFEIPHRERIDRIRRRYERVRGRMRSVLAAAGERSAFELGRKLYRGHAEATPFLVMSEVIGCLDYLDRSGELEQVEDAEGGIRFRLSPLGRRDDDADLPTRLRIDSEGRWYHDDQEVTHPGTLEMFVRALEREEDGRFVVRSGQDRMAVDVEDAPHLVRGVDPEGSGFRLDLGHGLSAPLDPDALEVGARDVLYTRLPGGLEARFSRPAYYQLAHSIEEVGAGSFALVTPDGCRHAIVRRTRGASEGTDVPA